MLHCRLLRTDDLAVHSATKWCTLQMKPQSLDSKHLSFGRPTFSMTIFAGELVLLFSSRNMQKDILAAYSGRRCKSGPMLTKLFASELL